MGGTKSGGEAAAITNRVKYGEEFYVEIGKIGGRNSSGYAFGHGVVDPAVVGAIGGFVSRRGSDAHRSRLKPFIPESQKTCTFCTKTGHSALYCPVRANVKQRKQVIAAKRRVAAEERAETMQKLNRIDSKYGVKRPW